MGVFSRLTVTAVAYLSNTVLLVIYIRAGVPLAQLAQGPFSGPFTAPVDLMLQIIPIVIGFIYLIFGIFLLIGPVQEETAATRVRSRRRSR